MSLFQPSNIVPSAWAGEGQNVVDVNDNIEISWQVNGTTPLVSFSIDIYISSALENPIATLLGTVDNTEYPNGFYPADEDGNPQIFTYSPGFSWSSIGLLNGGKYVFKITQFPGEVRQNSFSSFITRKTPSVSLYVTGENTARLNISAEYSQEQGDTVASVRWIVIKDGKIISDTGTIYTSQIFHVFDGVISNTTYTIRLIVTTSSGASVQSETDVHVSYDISYSETTPSILLLDGGEKISFLDSATNIPLSSGNNYSVNTQEKFLSISGSVSWRDIPQNLLMDGSFKWRATGYNPLMTLYENNYFNIVNEKNQISFSENSDYVVDIFSEYYNGGIRKRARVGITNATRKNVKIQEYLPDIFPSSVKFCNVGIEYYGVYFLVVSYEGVRLYKIDENGTVSSFGLIFEGKNYNNDTVVDMDFSPDGKNFAIVGSFSGRAHYYSFDQSTGAFTFISNIKYDGSSNISGVTPSSVKFAPQNYQCLAVSIGNRTSSGQHGIVFYTYTESSLTYYNSADGITGVTIYGVDRIGFSTGANIFVAALFSATDAQLQLFRVGESGNQLSISYGGSAYCGMGNIDAISFKDDSTFIVTGSNKASFFDASSAITRLFTQSNIGVVVCEYFNRFLILSSLRDTGISDGGWYGLTTAANMIVAKKEGNTVFRINNVLSKLNFIFGQQTYESDASEDMLVEITGNQLKLNNTEFIITGDPDFSFDEITLYGYQVCKELYSYNKTSFSVTFTNDELNGGTYSEQGTYANIIYSGINEKNIGEIPTAFDSIIVYGNKSYSEEQYNIFLRDSYGKYVFAQKTDAFCRRYNAFYLFETTQDESQKTVFHVQKVWKFSNNIDGGTVTNNNNPNWLTNFTKYRLRQPSKRIGKSGTLSGLIGNALNGVYADTAAQLKDLMQASESNNTFFLKDPKGNIYMIGISAPIQGTVAWGTSKLQTTISIPWEEIGNADEVSLIATPNDGGWVDTSNPTQNTITENNASEEEPQTNNEEEPFDPNVVSA